MSSPEAEATPAEAAAEEEEELPSCACGTTRGSKYALCEREYTYLGTLYLLWGGTAIPTKVKFRCVKCDKYFDESKAPSVCRQFLR